MVRTLLSLLKGGAFLAFYCSFVPSSSSINAEHKATLITTFSKNPFGKSSPMAMEIDGFQ